MKHLKTYKVFEEAPPFDQVVAKEILGPNWTEEELELLQALGADEIRDSSAIFEQKEGYTIFCWKENSNMTSDDGNLIPIYQIRVDAPETKPEDQIADLRKLRNHVFKSRWGYGSRRSYRKMKTMIKGIDEIVESINKFIQQGNSVEYAILKTHEIGIGSVKDDAGERPRSSWTSS